MEQKREKVQTPVRTICRRFSENKAAMTGAAVFLLIFLSVFIGPLFFPLDLSYSESTQANMPPGRDLMKVPPELKENIADIAVGPAFSVGLSTEGKVFVWGHGKVTGTEDVSEIPQEVQESFITAVAAGNDHVVALSAENRIFVWGNTRLGQGNLPEGLKTAGRIVQIAAGNQCSAAVDENGTAYLWGNENLCDIKLKEEYQGRIRKIVFTGFAYAALLDDGTVAYTGRKETAIAEIPAKAKQGGVADIAATAQTAAAVLEDGSVVVWGNSIKGEDNVPDTKEEIVKLCGGRYHYTALTKEGTVLSWGADNFGQASPPEAKKVRETATLAAGQMPGTDGEKAVEVFGGGYQNYALYEDGSLKTWGLKGYLCGTDELGRDIFTRLLSGGRMTMTVGAVAVLISTALGIVIGGISGYFGGKVDLLLQRFAEIVGALPFLPFAMILSSVIGSSMPESSRILLIMTVLGALNWTGLARLVRAQVLAEREKEFVTAARSIGVREAGIVFRHVIPNVLSVIIVSATLDFATCMLTESALSYLGFGVMPPQPTWGNMLSGANNSTVIQNYWWRWVFPAAVFSICTICIHLIGDGFKDAVDPKSEER